ncbi:hypothetical protein BASA62_009732 [Batrachochytrium salamandrivorans]|nr:hypothetical protein BASA62_009732 [Batrachochytrium salamandrivorans]
MRTHGKPYPFRHRLVGATSQLTNFHKTIPGGIATVWIDTAHYGYLQESQLTILPAPDYHASSPYIPAPQSPSNQPTGPDLLRHLRLHRGAKYIHSPHPDRVLRPNCPSIRKWNNPIMKRDSLKRTKSGTMRAPSDPPSYDHPQSDE